MKIRYGDENYHNTEKLKETISKRTKEEWNTITKKAEQTRLKNMDIDIQNKTLNIEMQQKEQNISMTIHILTRKKKFLCIFF